MKIELALLAVFIPWTALAVETSSVNLLPEKDAELRLPYGEVREIEFVCPWDAQKIPTVLEFTARIDTPKSEALTGGPVPLLKLELNGQILDDNTKGAQFRLLNKPMKSDRDLEGAGNDVVWFSPPYWELMYTGSWDPPPNRYTPRQGSPVRFILDVADCLQANGKNKLVLTYNKSMVGDQPLDEYCRSMKTGDATVVLGELTIRPRKDSDAFPSK